MAENVDRVVEAVRDDLLRRSQFEIAKYGTTLERRDLSLRDWLQHAYEECTVRREVVAPPLFNMFARVYLHNLE